jgi:hypothetical protein
MDKKIHSELTEESLLKEITNLYASASSTSRHFNWRWWPSFTVKDLSSNLNVKIISLLLALILWYYVKYFLGR